MVALLLIVYKAHCKNSGLQDFGDLFVIILCRGLASRKDTDTCYT